MSRPTVGVSLPTYHYDPAALAAWEHSTGLHAGVLQTFISWQYPGKPGLSDFPVYRAQQFAARGTMLEVTWAPATSQGALDQSAFRLAEIAKGEYDAYIRRFAGQIRAFGGSVRLRFAHEMNGTFVPYSEARSGNKPGDFVRAWRHVHDVVASAGATNVIWVWSVNVISVTSTPIRGLYPGDQYVDEVGVDGYSYPKARCLDPVRLFAPSVHAVEALTNRPLRITEVGVATSCPRRASWLSSFFAFLKASRRITGYTWWERAGGGLDYRVVPTDLAAFRRNAP